MQQGSGYNMSIEYMRHKVAEAYDGDSWKKRVSRMPDTQVEAIYDRLLESGRIHTIPPLKVNWRGSRRLTGAIDDACGQTVDETAYGREGNRVRTDEIVGQIEFGDL